MHEPLPIAGTTFARFDGRYESNLICVGMVENFVSLNINDFGERGTLGRSNFGVYFARPRREMSRGLSSVSRRANSRSVVSRRW